MIAVNIIAEDRKVENSGETQSSNTLGAFFLFWEDTSGAHTLTDREVA